MARFNLSDYPAQTAGQVRPHPLNPATTRSHWGWGHSHFSVRPVQDDCAGPASESWLPSLRDEATADERVFRGTLGLGSQVHHARRIRAFACSASPQKGNLAYAYSPLGGVSSRLADGLRLDSRTRVFFLASA